MQYNLKELYSGRIGRKDYTLGQLLIGVIPAVLFSVMGGIISSSIPSFFIVTFSIFIFIVLILCVTLSFSLHVRRFHDLGLSGYHVFLLFIPILNLSIFALFLKKGEENQNEFGEKPAEQTIFLKVLFGNYK